ncbi:hypothetical protein RLOatenuis_5020 [Rickettsiales bacterium]|nr:hypothetical protein RLOatenuis_5020 [Rickettsiales bacterium]
MLLNFNIFNIFKKQTGGIKYTHFAIRYFIAIVDLSMLLIFLQISTYVSRGVIDFFVHIPEEVVASAKEKIITEIELDPDEQEAYNKIIRINILDQLIQLAVISASTIFVWYKLSSSPAKMLFGIRIVNATTFGRISKKQSIKRFCSYPLSLLPLGLGIIWCIFDRRRQTWHDKIANTAVVYKESLTDIKSEWEQPDLIDRAKDGLKDNIKRLFVRKK